MPDGLQLSDALAAKFEECKKELGFTGDLVAAKHLVKNYPESVDLTNPADRLFQSVAGM